MPRIRHYLLDEVIGKSKLPEGIRRSMSHILGGFAEFRRHVPHIEASGSDALAWRAGWPLSADLGFALVED